MNPYLKAKREQYDALRAGIEGVQTRAATENRDLTDDELASIRSQGETAHKLAAEITDLAEIENRHAQIAALGAKVEADVQNRTEPPAGVRVSATTQDRDPGHYRSVKDGGTRSFFADVVKARYHQDQDALGRLTDHNRALDSSDGPGVLPPVWMSAEFVELARQQRRVANAVRNLPLTDPRPMSMPRQATDAGAPVVQSAENAATNWTQSWSSAVDTVNPVTIVGGEELSRQLLDSATPAIDSLIWGNLIAQYNSQVEARVVKAMADSAGAPAVPAYADEDAWTAGLEADSLTYVGDAILDTAIAVRNGRKLPGNVLVASVNRYGSLLKMKDSTGRPMIPSDSGGAMNVIGTGDVAVDGRIHGLGILASDGVTQYPESLLVARTQDVILFESPTIRFRFDEPRGPESIRLGVWGYVATYIQYAGTSVRRIEITGPGV